ncbi:hypothetical protein BSZ36_07240 [Rubricoccus marinus]|uniref:Histidine kinase/HSP90-like ATPase domain-containing protein n=1 Tax=Rubricoccus marinus TaxID=716817 RepID=A0A259TYD0_9BACT|nr:hypothetical protein BSZ36_07240 [Rubricoccus marinus]
MVTLALPSTPESVTRAVEAAEGLSVQIGLSEETTSRVGLAVAEAVANAIEHGNRGIESSEVRVHLAPEARVLHVTIQDEGHGVDSEQLREASLPDDPLQTGGRGLFLIRELSDRAEAAGTRLSLWFSDRS